MSLSINFNVFGKIWKNELNINPGFVFARWRVIIILTLKMYEEGLTYSFYVNFIPDCIFHVLEKSLFIFIMKIQWVNVLVGFKMITWKLDFFSQDSLNIRSPPCKTKMPDSNSNQESEKNRTLNFKITSKATLTYCFSYSVWT